MESPPPVPLKDTPYRRKADMEGEGVAVMVASGSKRKRQVDESAEHCPVDVADMDAHTPKRPRSSARHSEPDLSDDATPAQKRNIRRKKGIQNLSNLNLRHEAKQQAEAEAQSQAASQPRGSKFQEGSLTDKPSAQPPSAFTRFMRTDSGNIQLVDDLMADYHNGMPTPRESVGVPEEAEPTFMPQHARDAVPEDAPKEANSGLLRFGRSFAASFHPVALWNKIWTETKEELTQRNIEELERKRRQKAEAEARYAEMKQAGQLGLKHVGRTSGESATPRDSGIALGSTSTSIDQVRTNSYGTYLAPPTEQNASRYENEAPDTTSKPGRTLKSRLHFKRPSISNLRHGLKRVSSEVNLTAPIHRESSSSVSPVKTDAEASTLRRSHSRVDMKKQHKLSKRVSDLEAKLHSARKELEVALVQASPMPKAGSKYERFTPNSTLKRSRFTPGLLPSLPSERLLDPAQISGDVEVMDELNPSLLQTREARDSTEHGPEDISRADEHPELNDDMDIDQDTIKASRGRSYPPRASTLHGLDDSDIKNLEHTHSAATEYTVNQVNIKIEDMALDHTTQEAGAEPSMTAAQADSADYATLDAKLKALENNTKAAKNAGKGKKRKSAHAKDASFVPGRDEDVDDEEWETAKGTPKKHKQTANKVSPDGKRKTQAGKRLRGKKGVGESSSPNDKKKGAKQATIPTEPEEAVEEKTRQLESDEANDIGQTSARTSIDSIARSLEPLYEEEEETSAIPLNDEPSRPTAKATPARYGRPRSTSPVKHDRQAKPGAEEKIITRAAHVAQMGRSASPGTGYERSRGGKGVEIAESDAHLMEAGHPRSKESFEWPEDVF